MKIYHYDDMGIFCGESEAEESPLEPGVFLVPANATETAPPTPGAGQRGVFAGGAWVLQAIPVPPVPPVPTAAEIAAARKAEILGLLAQIDARSIRPLRESDAARVAALEAQAVPLRAELATP